MQTKKCGLCEQTKPAKEFYKHRNSKDGLGPYCKKCCYEYDSSRSVYEGVKAGKYLKRSDKIKGNIELYKERIASTGNIPKLLRNTPTLPSPAPPPTKPIPKDYTQLDDPVIQEIMQSTHQELLELATKYRREILQLEAYLDLTVKLINRD